MAQEASESSAPQNGAAASAPNLVAAPNNNQEEVSNLFANLEGGDNEQQQQPVVVADAAASAAADASNGGNNGTATNNNAPPPPPPRASALANDLSTYFTNLSTALQRQHESSLSQNGTSNNNSATGYSTAIITLLKEGVAPITAAGNEGGNTNSTSFVPPSMTPKQGALYLYAVSQNIVALEAAVLGSGSGSGSMFASAAAGGEIDGAGSGSNGNVLGGVSTARQVVEIVLAVSTAATFCNSRSIVSRSGILPALAHLIESTGTITAPPSTLMDQSKAGVLHSLTPFHSEFLQVALLAGQYRYASAFLASHPMSQTTLDFPYLRIDPSSYLRTHYYAGLVHVGCNNWNAALDSFHLCLTMPCSSVNAVAVAARKKSLLVQCLLLESEELDGNNTDKTKTNVQERGSGGNSPKSALESKVLNLPGAASAAVCKYMTASSSHVGSGTSRRCSETGSSAPEMAGAETSEQQSSAAGGGGGRGERSSRRRMRPANSNASSSDAAGGERERDGADDSKAKKYSNLGSYHDLVSTYISGNASHYAKLLTEMVDLLHSDGNWGLAKQLEGRLLAYRLIRKVASVYSVVGVNALEKKMQEAGSTGEVGKHGIEDLLMGMAACDAKDPLLVDPFIARIDHPTGSVSFLDHDDGESDDECDEEEWMDADLSNRLQSCVALAERVRDLDIILSTSPKYQQYSQKEKMMKGDRGASSMHQGASVADIANPMDIGGDNW